MRTVQSFMLSPVIIISIPHALWSGLRWMRHVLSASTIFSREMNRYKKGSLEHSVYTKETKAVRTKLLGTLFLQNELPHLAFALLFMFTGLVELFFPSCLCTNYFRHLCKTWNHCFAGFNLCLVYSLFPFWFCSCIEWKIMVSCIL